MSLDIARLKLLRLKAKKKQEDIALFLNITRAAYTNIELGKREPDLSTISALADYYNVSTDYLLGRTDVKSKQIALSTEEINLVSCFRLACIDDKNVIWAALNKYKQDTDIKKEAT